MDRSLRDDEVIADFFGSGEVTKAAPGRVAIAKDNARLFVGNVVNNHAEPLRYDTVDIDSERLSLVSTSGADLITLTTKVLEAATPVTSALRSCQKQAARFKIAALSIASLHTECSTIRTTLYQIKSMLSRDGQALLSIDPGWFILEDYYGVLEFSWLLFNLIFKSLASLGLTTLDGISKDDFTTNMSKFWEFKEMDGIIQVLGRQARAIDLFHVAFQSETEQGMSAVMKSTEAKQVLESISSDTISLHESFQAAPDNIYDTDTASVTGVGDFDFNHILENTALYKRALRSTRVGLPPRYGSKSPHVDREEAGPSSAQISTSTLRPSDIPTEMILEGITNRRINKSDQSRSSDLHTNEKELATLPHGQRLSTSSESSTETVKAKADTQITQATGAAYDRAEKGAEKGGSFPASDPSAPSEVIPTQGDAHTRKIVKGQPTLWEVLSRKTTKPYTLFEFYIYMRDIQRSVDYLDFWLDVAQHKSLCRHYVRGLFREGRPKAIGPTDNDGLSQAGSETTFESSTSITVRREDVRASAEKILYTFLLAGSQREIVLPTLIVTGVTEAIESEGRHDSEVFDVAQDYVFKAMENDAFPGFLNLSRPVFRMFRRSGTLGSLVNKLYVKGPRFQVAQGLDDGGSGIRRIPPSELFHALDQGKPPKPSV